MEFDLKKPFIVIEKEIIDMVEEKDGITDNAQIGDVVVNKVVLKDVESAVVTLKRFWEQRPMIVTPLI